MSERIIIVGDSGVGKTALFNCCKSAKSPILPSIGAEFAFIYRNIGEKTFKLEMWDIAGRNEFCPAKLPVTNVVIYVFDLSNRESFNAINSWNLRVSATNIHAQKILWGNKLDKKRCISLEEATEKAISMGATQYCEVSATNSSALVALDDYLKHSYNECDEISESGNFDDPDSIVTVNPLVNALAGINSESGNFDDPDSIVTVNPLVLAEIKSNSCHFDAIVKPIKRIDPEPEPEIIRFNIWGFTIMIEGDIWALLGCPRRTKKLHHFDNIPAILSR